MDDVTRWYNRNAPAYQQEVDGLDLSLWYRDFLHGLPAGALILDAGCGTGRDSLAFCA